MAWLPSYTDLPEHPKLKRLVRRLGIPRAQAIGHLHLLWYWCLSYADDGDLSSYEPADIAEAAEWPGDPDEFVEALLDCGAGDKAGFLERDEQGRLRVHDWEDYAGQWVQKRKADAARKREWRAETSGRRPSDRRKPSRGRDADATEMSGGRDKDATRGGARRGEERREEESIPPISPQDVTQDVPPEDASLGEREMLRVLSEVESSDGHRYPVDYAKDLKHLRSLASRFPDVDLLKVVRDLQAWSMDHRVGKSANWRLRLTHFVENASRWKQGGQERASPGPDGSLDPESRRRLEAAMQEELELSKGAGMG